MKTLHTIQETSYSNKVGSTRADFVISQSAHLFTKWQNLAFDVTNTIESKGEL